MLGAILERESGLPYATLLQQMILDPLALHDTQFPNGPATQLPVLHTSSSDRDAYLKTNAFEDTTLWDASWVS